MKILVVVDNLEIGGVANVVNNFSELCQNEVVFDYITYIVPSANCRKRLEYRGSKIFSIKRVTKTLPHMYINSIKKIILENGEYDAIHLHTAYFIWLGALAAYHMGIKNIVGHAHGSQWIKSNFFIRLVEKIGRLMNRKYCTKMFACSNSSGEYTFGKDYEFLPNIISIHQNDFEFSDLKEELGVKNTDCIIGYLGMFTDVKYSKFLLNIAAYLEENEFSNYMIIAAGDGIDFKETVDTAIQMKLTNIKFLGYRKDAFNLLNMFDVLIVPSLSEGMSLSILESQLIGTPVVASKGVPKTNDLDCGLFDIVDNYSEEEWINMIKFTKYNKVRHNIDDVDKILKKVNYDGETIKNKLLNAYSGIYENK